MLMLVNTLCWVKSWSIQADDGSAKAFQGTEMRLRAGWMLGHAPQQHQPQGKGLSTCSLRAAARGLSHAENSSLE